MRTYYEAETAPPTTDAAAEARVRLFLQLAVMAFWAPAAGLDLWALWRNHGMEGLQFVFWLLFRQSLVFLALWFTVSITHGLIRGRRTKEATGRQRRVARKRIAATAAAGGPSRSFRGQ